MDRVVRRRRLLVRGTIIVLVLLLLIPLIYCCGIPIITGQVCYDFVSGHVPPRAIDRFLDRLFEATMAEDYEWLATISSAEALGELREAQHVVTTGYEIILRDNLIGFYEYRIRFDNGAVVYVNLQGVWHACPDFTVTEEEIFRNVKLVGIEVESE